MKDYKEEYLYKLYKERQDWVEIERDINSLKGYTVQGELTHWLFSKLESFAVEVREDYTEEINSLRGEGHER